MFLLNKETLDYQICLGVYLTCKKVIFHWGLSWRKIYTLSKKFKTPTTHQSILYEAKYVFRDFYIFISIMYQVGQFWNDGESSLPHCKFVRNMYCLHVMSIRVEQNTWIVHEAVMWNKQIKLIKIYFEQIWSGKKLFSL